MPADFFRHIPTGALRMIWHRRADSVVMIDSDGQQYAHDAAAFAAQYEHANAAQWRAEEVESE